MSKSMSISHIAPKISGPAEEVTVHQVATAPSFNAAARQATWHMKHTSYDRMSEIHHKRGKHHSHDAALPVGDSLRSDLLVREVNRRAGDRACLCCRPLMVSQKLSRTSTV